MTLGSVPDTQKGRANDKALRRRRCDEKLQPESQSRHNRLQRKHNFGEDPIPISTTAVADPRHITSCLEAGVGGGRGRREMGDVRPARAGPATCVLPEPRTEISHLPPPILPPPPALEHPGHKQDVICLGSEMPEHNTARPMCGPKVQRGSKLRTTQKMECRSKSPPLQEQRSRESSKLARGGAG